MKGKENMKKQTEFTVYDGDSLGFIAHWIADATSDISEKYGQKVKSFKITITVEDKEES